MRRIPAAMLVLLAWGCGGPREVGRTEPSPALPRPATPTLPSAPPMFAAEVVVADVPNRRLTVREASAVGGERTLDVGPAALAALDRLKPGDPVKVACDVSPVPTIPGEPVTTSALVATCSSVIGIESPAAASAEPAPGVAGSPR